MRVVGLMIAFACFNACIGQVLDSLNGTDSGLTVKRWKALFTAFDTNRDGIVEMKEHSTVIDCYAEKLNMNEETKKRIFEDFTKAWKSFEFDKAESGFAFHPDVMVNIFTIVKRTPRFKDGVRVAFALLFNVLRSYSNRNAISIDELRVFHSCMGVDLNITSIAFDKIDANKDGGISEDEFCNAGETFMLDEEEDCAGSHLLGKIKLN